EASRSSLAAFASTAVRNRGIAVSAARYEISSAPTMGIIASGHGDIKANADAPKKSNRFQRQKKAALRYLRTSDARGTGTNVISSNHRLPAASFPVLP